MSSSVSYDLINSSTLFTVFVDAQSNLASRNLFIGADNATGIEIGRGPNTEFIDLAFESDSIKSIGIGTGATSEFDIEIGSFSSGVEDIRIGVESANLLSIDIGNFSSRLELIRAGIGTFAPVSAYGLTLRSFDPIIYPNPAPGIFNTGTFGTDLHRVATVGTGDDPLIFTLGNPVFGNVSNPGAYIVKITAAVRDKSTQDTGAFKASWLVELRSVGTDVVATSVLPFRPPIRAGTGILAGPTLDIVPTISASDVRFTTVAPNAPDAEWGVKVQIVNSNDPKVSNP